METPSFYIRGDDIHDEGTQAVPNVWYNFICATLKPSLHITTMTRDKTILLYVIVQGIKFDVGHVIERGILEYTQGRIEALIPPSLITQLCRIVEVPMLESEEKSHHQLPLSLPKLKDGAPDDMEDEEGEALVVGQ